MASFVDSMLQAKTLAAVTSSVGNSSAGSSNSPSPPHTSGSPAATIGSMDYYQQLLNGLKQGNSPASATSNPALMGDFNAIIRNHFLNNPPPAEWMQMNLTAPAAIPNPDGHNRGAVVDEDEEEEEEEEDVNEEEEMVVVEGSAPEAARGRRGQGRPASASIARDGKLTVIYF